MSAHADHPRCPDDFADMEWTMLDEGYERGAPRPTRIARAFGVDGSAIDEEVCSDAGCPRCGHRGMDYHPFVGEVVRHDYFTGEPRREYRAFAVCAADGCGYWHEF